MIRVAAFPDVGADEYAMQQLTDGLSNAAATIDLDGLDGLPRTLTGDHPALLAWDRLVNEAVDDVAPTAARMLTDAIRARLPWEWRENR